MPFYGPFTASYPYIFAGGGLLSFNYPVNDANGNFMNKASNTAFGYSIGVGYEIIFGKHCGISAEAGYGAMGANLGSVDDVFTYSLGFHYYFSGRGSRPVRVRAEAGEEANPDEQEQPSANEEQSADDQQPPVRKSRRHRERREDEDE
jgi:hypothetical protein